MGQVNLQIVQPPPKRHTAFLLAWANTGPGVSRMWRERGGGGRRNVAYKLNVKANFEKPVFHFITSFSLYNQFFT
jgi:hypothetical protein